MPKVSRQGKTVLVLESGHFGEDEKKQALNEVQQTGKILSNAVWGRKRAVGGTTIACADNHCHLHQLILKKEIGCKIADGPFYLKR